MKRRSPEGRPSTGGAHEPNRAEKRHSDAVARRIQDLLESTPARLAGLELVDVEIRREGRRMVIRVLIDRDAPGVEPGRGGGITIEDCSRVSRMLGDYLDGDSEVAPLVEALGAYSLEVSSPGIDRPLMKPEHFTRYRGQTATITTHEKILGRANHRGIIAEVTPASVIIDQPDLGRTEIQFAEIRKANLRSDPWQIAREAMARQATAPDGVLNQSDEGPGESPTAGEDHPPRAERSNRGRSTARQVDRGREAGIREARRAAAGTGNPGSRRGHRGGTEA